MAASKIAVSLEADLVREVDRWVAKGDYPSRSRAVRAGLLALKERRLRRRRLLGELSRLDPAAERRLADERLGAEVPWPAS